MKKFIPLMILISLLMIAATPTPPPSTIVPGVAGPAKPHAQTDHSPIVGALIEKQRLPGAHRMNIDPVPFEVVGKGLLDIENTPEDGWFILRKVIENLVHVFRIEHGAVEIGGEMLHPVVRSDAGHRDETLIIPVGIVASQFDFQAF